MTFEQVNFNMCNITNCVVQLEEFNSSEILSYPEFQHPFLLTLLAFFSVVTVVGNLLVNKLFYFTSGIDNFLGGVSLKLQLPEALKFELFWL